MSWRPIETAPRDRVIRVRDADEEVFNAKWWTPLQLAKSEGGEPSDWDGGWYEAADDEGGVEPTFWWDQEYDK